MSNNIQILNQPTGMFVIGLTEVFERLSFYTLSALLVLYASASTSQGGLGWSNEAALLLAGKFTFAIFTVPLIGGYIADKFLGAYRAAILGSLIIITGHTIMYFSDHGLTYFYTALALIVSGTSLFTPSTPTLLGALYGTNDPRRESGFNLYYMGINIGGLIAGFSAGILLQRFGYQVALSSAAVGMTIGLTILLIGKKYLITTQKIYPSEMVDANHKIKNERVFSLKDLSPNHKKAVWYLLLSFVFYCVWAVVYNITVSGTFSIYIENFTYKNVFGYEIPTTFFSSLESIGIVIFAPIVTFILAVFIKKNKPVHFFTQMALALVFTFVSMVYFTYLTHVAQSVAPGTKPFHFLGMSVFVLLVSLSEILISPVAMAAISVLSPVKLRSSFQALNLSLIGFMGLISGKIGAISLSNPYKTFFVVSVVTCIGMLAFLAVRRPMVSTSIKAESEFN